MSNDRSLPSSTRIIYAVFDTVLQYGRRRLLSAIAMLAVVAVIVSGFYIVKKEEQGVRLRFGKVVEAVVEPGMHYAVPFIETVHIRKIKRINRAPISGDAESAYVTVLSGDTNLLEMNVNLQYRIDNLRNFLFTVSDPQILLRMLVREELVNIAGQNFIDLILTSNRNVIQDHLFDEVTRQLEALDIGLELITLNIVDIRPIEETLAAFRDVNDAISERMQAISNANLKKERLIARTRGQAEALIQDAKAKAREREVQAQSSASAYAALLAQYRKAPEQVAITRYWQRMRNIFAEASLSAVNPGNEANIEINLIDGFTGQMPPHVSAAPSRSGQETLDRPLLSTVLPEIHAVEKIEEDNPLLDGQYHSVDAERDHMTAAEDHSMIGRSRSLIFDMPSIFSHDHVSRSNTSSTSRATGHPVDGSVGSEKPENDASDMNEADTSKEQHDQNQ